MFFFHNAHFTSSDPIATVENTYSTYVMENYIRWQILQYKVRHLYEFFLIEF